MLHKLDSFLSLRKEQELYRTRQILESPQETEVIYQGKHYISFCSNNYLGLANHPKVKEAFIHAANQYGVGSGASHLLGGHGSPHHLLEEELAEFTGYPRTLLFSTGYMANVGVLTGLLGREDSIFEDRLNHASLIDGGQFSKAKFYRYHHADVNHLFEQLAKADSKNKWIVSDGVFSVDGDFAPLPSLVECARQTQATLMIDDAHGWGAVGSQGKGTLSHFGLKSTDVPIMVGTLGKAFGTFGAFVAADSTIIESLIQCARSYIYTTALPPAIAEATRMSLKLIQEEEWRRVRLKELIDYFKSATQQLKIPLLPSETPIQPVLIGETKATMRIYEALKQKGILVGAIRPPTVPEGTARLRITLCAMHTESQLDRLLTEMFESLLSEQVLQLEVD